MSVRYLIPRRIMQRWEVMPGWGWRQIAALGVGLGVGAVLALLGWLIHLPIWLLVLLVLLPAGSGAGVAMPMPTGGSMLDLLLDAQAYGQAKHFYLFDLRKEDC